jgi:hypothetical protein
MLGVVQVVASEAASSIARGSEEEDDDDDDDDDDHEDKCLPDVHHASSNRREVNVTAISVLGGARSTTGSLTWERTSIHERAPAIQ